MAEYTFTTKSSSDGGWLGRIERIGNRLPDPATLFLIGTVLVMIAPKGGVGTLISTMLLFTIVFTIV